MNAKVRRALISVSDKTGVVTFARGLRSLGVEILSTGGTARLLRDSGLKVIEVSDYQLCHAINDSMSFHPAWQAMFSNNCSKL